MSSRDDSPPAGVSPDPAVTADSRGFGEAGRPVSFFHSLGALGFVSGAGLLFNIVLARVLEVEDFGHIRIVRSILELCAVAAIFGMDGSIAKFTADTRITPDERTSMLATGSMLSLIAAVIVTAAAFAILQTPGILRDEVALGILNWMILILPALALYNCILGYLLGVGRIKRLAAAQVTRSALLLALGIGLAGAFKLPGWAAARVLAEALALAFAVHAVWKLKPWKPCRAYIKSFLGYGFYDSLTLGMTTLVTTIDVLCLDRFLDGGAAEIAQTIGQYAVATLLFSAALLLPQAFVQSNFSKMAGHGHDADRTWRLFVRYTILILSLAVPAALAGYFAAPAVVWIFGPDYAQAGEILRWFMPAFVIQSAGIVGINFVGAAGRMRAGLFGSIGAAAACAALNIFMIPVWGIAGAVIATTAAYALRATFSALILFRYKSAGTMSPGE